jgi:hypothetical protein
MKNHGQALIETLVISSFSIVLIGSLLFIFHHECLKIFTENAVHEALICEQTLNRFDCKRKLSSFCNKLALNLNITVEHPSKGEYKVTYYNGYNGFISKKIYLQVYERFL